MIRNVSQNNVTGFDEWSKIESHYIHCWEERKNGGNTGKERKKNLELFLKLECEKKLEVLALSSKHQCCGTGPQDKGCNSVNILESPLGG